MSRITGFGSPDKTYIEKLFQLNWQILLIIFLIAGVGFSMLYSAANGDLSPWASRQMLRFGIGVVLMLVISVIDIRFWLKVSYALYGISFILLAKKILQNEDSRMIQRLIESGIRHYFAMNPDDNEGLIPIAWVSCNSESKSKLSSMLIELAKINQQSFLNICSKVLKLSPESYDELFNRIDLRNKDISSLIRNNQ